MEKKIEDGEEVLIFNYIPGWGTRQDMENYRIGKVIRSEETEYTSYYGNVKHVINYFVEDHDGNKYFGNYAYPDIGNYFFLTKEDYINRLKDRIEANQENINIIYEESMRLQKIIETVKGKDKVLKKEK